MDNNSENKAGLNLKMVGLMSTLALSSPLHADFFDQDEALSPSAAWVSQYAEVENGYISLAVMAEHKYGVASVDFYLDGKLHTQVVQETFNPETGEYEFLLRFESETQDKKHRVSAVVNPFGVGSSHLLPELLVKA